jgi:hypothetical protein
MEQQTGALGDDDQRRKRTSTRRSRRWRPGAPDPEMVTTKARDGGPAGRLIRRRGGRIHRWRRAGQATEGLAPTGNQGGGRGKAQGGAGCGADIGDGGTTVRGGEGGGTRGGGTVAVAQGEEEGTRVGGETFSNPLLTTTLSIEV